MNEEKRVRLVSIAKHKYEGRWLYTGNKFEATAQDAEDLITLKFALPRPEAPREEPAHEVVPEVGEPETNEPEVDEPEVLTRDLDADQPRAYETRDMAPDEPRRYLSRDLMPRRPRGRPRKTGRY